MNQHMYGSFEAYINECDLNWDLVFDNLYDGKRTFNRSPLRDEQACLFNMGRKLDLMQTTA